MKSHILEEANDGLQELAIAYGLMNEHKDCRRQSDGTELGNMVHRIICTTLGYPCQPKGMFYPGQNLRILSRVILIQETAKLIFGLTTIEEVHKLLVNIDLSDYFWWDKSPHKNTYETLALPEHTQQ